MLGNKRGKYLRDYVSDYVVFDLETTGVSSSTDAIIEISAVKVRKGTVTDTFSTLVNPQRPISPAATAVNGITNEMVKEQPTIDEVMPGFIEFIEDLVLVGHNIHSFDMKFIWRDVERIFGQTITNNYLDTLPMSRKTLPALTHHRLVDIAAYYSVDTAGAHRALNDCIMNQICYENMHNEIVVNPPKQCPNCGGILKRRNGRYGEFWGCSEFPQCKYTENI